MISILNLPSSTLPVHAGHQFNAKLRQRTNKFNYKTFANKQTPHLTSKLVMIVIFSLVLTQINDFKTPEIELKYIRLDRSTQK